MLSTSASDNYQMGMFFLSYCSSSSFSFYKEYFFKLNLFLANPRNYTWKMPTRTTDPCIATNSCSCMLRLRLNVSFFSISILYFYLQFHSDFYIQVTSSESTGVTGNFIDSRNNLNTAIKVDPLIDLEGYAYSFPFFLLVVISLFQNVSRSVFIHLFIYFLFFFYQVGKCTTYDESLAVW